MNKRKELTGLGILPQLASLSVYAYKAPQGRGCAVPQNHDVFLSFRGPDSRTSFVDFLYSSLEAAGVHVFRDDDTLPIGEEIGPGLLRAIRSCRIAIHIISKQYSESIWCLRELAEIMDCHRKHGKSVFPVFYKVDIFHVRHLGGDLGEALSKQEEIQGRREEVIKWREALSSLTMIRGWISQTIANGHEGELVKIVVARVLTELKTTWIERLPMFPILMSNHHVRSCTYVGCEIQNAIDHCKISIPILSENYASSHYCLDELAQMVECKRTKGQKILPISYKVKPSNVQGISHRFGEDMLLRKELVNGVTYEQWERALRKIGSLKGWVSEKIANGHEGVLVKRVVKEVLRLLSNPQTRDMH